jgi:hypothetical protein
LLWPTEPNNYFLFTAEIAGDINIPKTAVVAIAQTELPVLQNKIAELEVANQQIPELQAQIEVLQTANAMGGLGQEPPIEPNLAQELESKLKLKGEIKGDIRMIKLGIKKGWLEEVADRCFLLYCLGLGRRILGENMSDRTPQKRGRKRRGERE